MAKTPASEGNGKGAGKSASKSAAPTIASHSPFFELRKRMDDLFDDFLSGRPGRSLFAPEMFDFNRLVEPLGLPRMRGEIVDVRFDVSETDKAIEITAEVPGIDEKEIEVTLSDGVLTIKGEKKAETEKQEQDYHLTERRYGAFSRSFRLPDTIDEAKVKASFDKGVLAVALPKRPQVKKQEKKIPIGKR